MKVLGFRVEVSWFRVEVSWFRVEGIADPLNERQRSGFRVPGPGSRVQG